MVVLRFLAYFCSISFFIQGLLATQGLTLYFKKPGYYIQDTLVIERVSSSSKPGSTSICRYIGLFKSDGEIGQVKCSLIDSLMGSDDKVFEMNQNMRKRKLTYDFALYRHIPCNTAHIYQKDKGKYYPGDQANVDFFSIATLLMLPLLLMFLTRYLRLRRGRRNQLGLWLLVLWSLGAVSLQAQAEGGGDTLYTFNIDYVSRQTIALDLVRYEDLALKKTAFDTTHFRLQYPEECLLGEISATDEATLKYCHENDDIRKNPRHYESIASMSPDDLYLQPTLKLVQYFPDDTIAWIKLYFVDNIRGRKIRAVKQMEWQNGRWQLSAEKLDADLAFALSGIRDEVLEAIFLRRYREDHELFPMQEACFVAGVFNLRALAKAYQSWFVKGHEQTDIIEKYGENLIQ